MVSKMGVTLREHEIQKSISSYYTSENGDFHLDTKPDLRKSLKSSNRSRACIVTTTLNFRLAAVAVGTLQKQSERSKSSRRVNPAACADPAEG